MTTAPFSITPRGVVGTAVVLVVATACVRLGFWQLDRRGQRADRNALVEARLTQPPAELSGAPRDTTGWLYRRVVVSGAPDAEHAIVLPGRLYRGAPGAHVLVPVRLNAGDHVLVDFGWAPAADGATVDFVSLQLRAPVAAAAMVRPFPGEDPGTRAPLESSPPSAEFRRVWYTVDAQAMRNQFPYGLGAVLLQLLPDSTAVGFPLRQPPPALDGGPHLGYAIQWFSFATIALVGWLVMVSRSRSTRSGNNVEQ